MAFVWLVGAVVLAAAAGLLEAHRSLPLVYVGIALGLAAVFAHVVAAVWPGHGPSNRVLVTRGVLGLVVGVLGFGFGGGYATNHLNWFGDRVVAQVTDSRTRCGVNDPRCGLSYRVSYEGRDLGWVSASCGGPIDGRIAVDVDPLGWVSPSSVDCGDPQTSARWVTGAWLTGVAALAVLILGSLAVERVRLRAGQASRS
ncbi:hypothetical protein [Virgisporangium ochraceum]|uniref:hypothetical protein n=1 Tax=Virgisporangium ochraceum TaxID=65505 RepID=UPI001940B295|nr:hypothetical protein [Virgisporangium ochraceum]